MRCRKGSDPLRSAEDLVQNPGAERELAPPDLRPGTAETHRNPPFGTLRGPVRAHSGPSEGPSGTRRDPSVTHRRPPGERLGTKVIDEWDFRAYTRADQRNTVTNMPRADRGGHPSDVIPSSGTAGRDPKHAQLRIPPTVLPGNLPCAVPRKPPRSLSREACSDPFPASRPQPFPGTRPRPFPGPRARDRSRGPALSPPPPCGRGSHRIRVAHSWTFLIRSLSCPAVASALGGPPQTRRSSVWMTPCGLPL